MTKSAPWPSMAWRTDPWVRGAAGLTHAAPLREDTAFCGVHTPFDGGRWPLRGEPWPATYSRCPLCARQLYVSRRP